MAVSLEPHSDDWILVAVSITKKVVSFANLQTILLFWWAIIITQDWLIKLIVLSLITIKFIETTLKFCLVSCVIEGVLDLKWHAALQRYFS